MHCQAWLAAHAACDDWAQQKAAAHRAVCERLCREEEAHGIATDDTSAVKSYNETEAISWMKAELDEQLIIHEVGVVKAARIMAESSPDTVKKCGCDCVVPTVCGCGCVQDVSMAADNNLSGDSETNVDLTEGEPERASQKSKGRAAPQSDQGKPAPSVSSVTDRAVAAAAQRVAAYSAANTEFVLGVMEARQPRATVSRPTCSRGKRDAIQRSRPGGRRRKHFMQRGLSLMLRDNLFAATLKALRNVDWSSIVCTLTVLTAITVMLLSGCLAVEAEDMPKQQVYQGAVLLAAEDWMGSYVCSTMYQFCAATASLVGCMMRLNTWHMWRMLFGWVKTQGSRIKFWLLFGWLVAANANYWSKVLSKELQHERSNGASLIVETEGEKLQEMVITECALAESFAPVRSVVDTNYGEDNPIIDSGCGQSIYPQSWLQRLGETLKLRPVRLQLRAANGGKMGMLGTTTMKFRLPGTTEWVNHDVMVADKGAIPDHIHILGNDFLKKMKASMDWTEEKLTGTTPSGESFTARMRMGGNKPSWCGAVDGAEEHEVQGSQLKGEDGAAILMHECRLQPGESQPIDTLVWGLQPAEQECMHWIPVPTTMEGEAVEATQRAYYRAEEGVVALVATNLTDKEMVLHAGDRMATLEAVTTLEASDVLPPTDVQLQQAGSLGIRQALDSTSLTMVVWMTIMCTTNWSEWHQGWYWLVMMAPMLNTMLAMMLAAVSLTAWGGGLDQWVNSVHQPEENDDSKARQTTTRHKPKTRLSSADPRSLEDGEETVVRIRSELRSNTKLSKEYEAWVKDIAAKFRFGDQLTEEEKDDLTILLFAYRELFIKNTSAPPAIDGIEYALYFRENDPIPVRRPIPRLSPKQLEHMEKQTADLLKNYLIQFSDSDWATNPVFAKKKDGTLRFAIDYRRINQSLLHESQPLPNIPETLEELGKSSRYSAWDACAGFWGIRIRPQDRKYTAFNARYQGAWHLVEWLRMPFGLKSATATYQRMMLRVMGSGECVCGKTRRHQQSLSDTTGHTEYCAQGLKNLVNSICKIFVDDGVTHSEQPEDHLNDLASVFKRLSANGISLKAAKCVWGTDKLPLLGHVVKAKQGISPDPDKVQALLQTKKPMLSNELRSFIGQAEYQRKFIPCLQEYLAPLRAIVNKCPYKTAIDISESWTQEAEDAFDTLKVALAQDTILRFPDFDAPFIIVVDTSRKTGVGAVLCQLDEQGNECPIEYASTPLTDAQRAFGISHLEGFGVCWAVKRWRRFLFGSVGIVITDHKSLKSLTNLQKDFDSPRMEKMALELSEYDLIIAHRAGARKDFGAADFTSRAEVMTPLEMQPLLGATFHDQAGIAVQLNTRLREECLKPRTQQMRLKQQINFADLKEEVKGSKVTTVREMVHLIKEGMRTPATRQLEEDEHVARIDEFYDMICTAAAEEETSIDISMRRIIEAQMNDKWSTALIKHIQTQAVWEPEDDAMAKQCRLYAPHFVVQSGVLMRVKFKYGTSGVHKEGSLPPVLQVYIPDDGQLRQQLVEAVHKETGHAGILRTYQALHDRCMWIGMFTQVMKTVQHCVPCQMHAPKAPAAPIQGHITAQKPGEVITMDLIEIASANGYKYILTAMDVFSKYAFAVPLTEATAVAVTEAVVHHIAPHGVGRPPYWVLDGGSEFKNVLSQVVEAWGGIPAKSSPNHPQSHGLIERYNRTLSNKIAKLLDESPEATWPDVLPAATEMINNMVQESLSDKDAWLAPSEVWFARNPVLEALPQGKTEVPVGAAQYVI